MSEASYIHGTSEPEQARLANLNRLTNQAFLEFLAINQESRVLEVGSGLGILAHQVAQRIPHGTVVGVELSSEQLARAPAAPNLSWVRADAHQLPFPDQQFDLVYCRYLLEHVARPADVLAEMKRVLRLNGAIAVQENNILILDFWPDCPRFQALWRKFAALQQSLGGDALVGKKLFALLQQAGFEQIELSLAPEVHSTTSAGLRPWLENLIGNVAGAAEAWQSSGLASRAELDAAIDELRAFAQRSDASLYFYWNRARAMRPQ